MLLNKIFATKEVDRYYFLYNFLCRTWILFYFLIFGSIISVIAFDFNITIKRFLNFCGAYILLSFFDGIRVYVKWWKMDKALVKEELSNFGYKKYH